MKNESHLSSANSLFRSSFSIELLVSKLIFWKCELSSIALEIMQADKNLLITPDESCLDKLEIV